jgi:hypothetical protein
MITKHEDTKQGDKMTYAHKKMLRFGLLRVQKCLQKTLNSDTITSSFSETGMYPLNFNKTLEKCLDMRSEQMDALILEKFDSFVQFFKENGHLTDKVLYDSGIKSKISDGSKKNRDELTISSQRAVLLSHPQAISRSLSVHDAAIRVAVLADENKEKRLSRKRKDTSSSTSLTAQKRIAIDFRGLSNTVREKNPTRNKATSKYQSYLNEDSDYEE